MPNTRAEIEAELASELGDAKDWLAEHETALPHIAEDRAAERPRERVTAPDGTLVDRVISLFNLSVAMSPTGEGEGDEREVEYGERSRFVPLTAHHEPIDLSRANVIARVEHVLTFMPAEQVGLLLDYYVGDQTWKDLRKGGESHQAVYHRVERARRAFLKAWLDHAQDDSVVITENHF